MGLDDHGDLGFQQGVGIHLNCSSSRIYMASQPEKVTEEKTMSPSSMCKSSNGFNSFYWDPLVSMLQNVDSKGSTMASLHPIAISSFDGAALENMEISNSSHHVQYPSDPSLAELTPKLPCFGNGSFSEMLSSLCLPEFDQFANAGCYPDNPTDKEGTGKTTTDSRKVVDQGLSFHGDLAAANEVVQGPSRNGKKRKRVLERQQGEMHAQFDSAQILEKEHQKDILTENVQGLNEQDEKKVESKQNLGSNMCRKLSDKQPKDICKNEQTPKEDYVHVRAKRGQATNSHSLAERLRRERISERMKLLQDLVPGCDKVNGKALMLDEIINYVQSLQRQVEFLSMKLATVNPDLNIDIGRLLQKDIFQSHASSSAILGFGPLMRSSHSPPHLTPQAHMQAIQRNEPNVHSVPPQISSDWDEELQNVIKTSLSASSSALHSMELNGDHMKV